MMFHLIPRNLLQLWLTGGKCQVLTSMVLLLVHLVRLCSNWKPQCNRTTWGSALMWACHYRAQMHYIMLVTRDNGHEAKEASCCANAILQRWLQARQRHWRRVDDIITVLVMNFTSILSSFGDISSNSGAIWRIRPISPSPFLSDWLTKCLSSVRLIDWTDLQNSFCHKRQKPVLPQLHAVYTVNTNKARTLVCWIVLLIPALLFYLTHYNI